MALICISLKTNTVEEFFHTFIGHFDITFGGDGNIPCLHCGGENWLNMGTF